MNGTVEVKKEKKIKNKEKNKNENENENENRKKNRGFTSGTLEGSGDTRFNACAVQCYLEHLNLSKGLS